MAARRNNLRSLATLASLFLIVAALYWGRPVLMPLAMALLLTFVLNPAVTLLRRCHLKHTLAVAVVVILAFSLLGAVLLGIGRQFNSLALALPRYEDNIREKIHDFRSVFHTSALDRTRQTLRDIKGELESTNETANSPLRTNNVSRNTASSAPTRVPAPVEPTGTLPDGSTMLTRLLSPLSNVMITAGFVVALVIFMLLRRDEMRDRLILLGGLEQRTLTTRILLEAGERISRYLLTYTMVNTIYGIAVAIGLYFFGLPYALLWGFFAGIVRFIPYVGPWVGVCLPVTLALAVFPGWLQPMLIVGYYAVIELITNMLLEPIFYGHSAGVSEVALLIALAFWTWVWGPVGLLLGTPLTVCLVVLAKHIPALESLHLLIGDGHLEEQCLIFYERLCNRNDIEAEAILRNHMKANPPLQVFDDLLLPALIFVKRDRQCGRLDAATEESILRNVRKSIEITKASNESSVSKESDPRATIQGTIVGIPSEGGEPEELALLMLKQSLHESGFDMEVLPAESPTTNGGENIPRFRPRVTCIGALPPYPAHAIQQITADLQENGYPGQIIVCRWGVGEQMDPRLARALGAEFEGRRLAETRDAIVLALSGTEKATDADPSNGPLEIEPFAPAESAPPQRTSV